MNNIKCLFAGIYIISLSVNLALAQSAEEIKKNLESSYQDWKLSEKVQTFNPENLYDFINGGADNYLSYNFQELSVFTYERGDKYITLEVYRHKGLPQAFGIYSSEKPSDAQFEKIGVQGYVGAGICNFYTGNYYIKISTHESASEIPALLRSMATDVAQKLVKVPQAPKALHAFPSIGRIPNSESFTNTNFLGYESLHSAYLSGYKKGDKTFKLFIIELPTTDAAKNMITAYAKAIKTNFTGNEGVFQFKDPYNGNIQMQWKGNYIWGIVNEQKVKIKENYLELIQTNLFGK